MKNALEISKCPISEIGKVGKVGKVGNWKSGRTSDFKFPTFTTALNSEIGNWEISKALFIGNLSPRDRRPDCRPDRPPDRPPEIGMYI